MEAFGSGETPAFERLVARHGRGLYNFLLRSVHDSARAEELLQEVFVRVISAKSRYRRSAKFSTWIYTIARNIAVDESRRARFRKHQSFDGAGANSGSSGYRPTVEASTPALQVPTDEAAEAPRLRRRLAAAIEDLPFEQKEVFLMRQVSGLSFREIGDAVGAPENTVKSRMRYALEKLRQELADLQVGDSPAHSLLHEQPHG